MARLAGITAAVTLLTCTAILVAADRQSDLVTPPGPPEQSIEVFPWLAQEKVVTDSRHVSLAEAALALEAPGGDQRPQIGAFGDPVFPGETLTVTGMNMDKARLHVRAAGRVFDVEPFRSISDRLQALIPTHWPGTDQPMPRTTMIAWPVNTAGGAGAPIRLNGPTLWWAWPCRVSADGSSAEVRLFGKNLALHPAEAHVVLRRVRDGKLWELPIQRADDYQIVAALPAQREVGVYEVFAHDGRSGAWGWSESASLEVVDPVRAEAVVVFDELLNASSLAADPVAARADVTRVNEAILVAMERIRTQGGGEIRFGEGDYHLSKPIQTPPDVAVIFVGQGRGEWDADRNVAGGKATVLRYVGEPDPRGRVGFIELAGRGSGMRDLAVAGEAKLRAMVVMAGQDQSLLRTTVARWGVSTGTPCVVNKYEGQDANQIIEDCDLFMSDICVRISASFVRITRCRMRGDYRKGWGAHANAVEVYGERGFIFEDCDLRSIDRTAGRIQGRTLLLYRDGIRHGYFSGNRSVDVGPHDSVEGNDANTGEQYLFHSRGATPGYNHQVVKTEGTRLHLNPPLHEAVNGNWIAFVSRGRGIGQWVDLVESDAQDSVLLARPWRLPPVPGDTITLVRAIRQHLILDNEILPNVPEEQTLHNVRSLGFGFWYKCMDNVIARNSVQNVLSGMYIYGRVTEPSAWNLVRDNRFESPAIWRARFGREMTAIREGYWPSDTGNSTLANTNIALSVGNTYRANEFVGFGLGSSIGFDPGRRLPSEIRHVPVDDQTGMLLTTIENNRFDEAIRAIEVYPLAAWFLWRNNDAKRGAGASASSHIYYRNYVRSPWVDTLQSSPQAP